MFLVDNPSIPVQSPTIPTIVISCRLIISLRAYMAPNSSSHRDIKKIFLVDYAGICVFCRKQNSVFCRKPKIKNSTTQ